MTATINIKSYNDNMNYFDSKIEEYEKRITKLEESYDLDLDRIGKRLFELEKLFKEKF